MPVHIELENHVASGLGMQEHLINLISDGTAWASATNLATYQAVNLAKEATMHETDKAVWRAANRYMATLHGMDIITDSDIAAANTTALWRTQFTEDVAIPTPYSGLRVRA